MELELRDLRMVRMIVEAGNLTKAASRLNISQPALSRQLLDLEARLGASLFQRQPRSMILTDIGREVLKVADEVIERIGQTERTIARRLDGHCGELKFGVHCIFSFSCVNGLRFERKCLLCRCFYFGRGFLYVAMGFAGLSAHVCFRFGFSFGFHFSADT